MVKYQSSQMPGNQNGRKQADQHTAIVRFAHRYSWLLMAPTDPKQFTFGDIVVYSVDPLDPLIARQVYEEVLRQQSGATFGTVVLPSGRTVHWARLPSPPAKEPRDSDENSG